MSGPEPLGVCPTSERACEEICEPEAKASACAPFGVFWPVPMTMVSDALATTRSCPVPVSIPVALAVEIPSLSPAPAFELDVTERFPEPNELPMAWDKAFPPLPFTFIAPVAPSETLREVLPLTVAEVKEVAFPTMEGKGVKGAEVENGKLDPPVALLMNLTTPLSLLMVAVTEFVALPPFPNAVVPLPPWPATTLVTTVRFPPLERRVRLARASPPFPPIPEIVKGALFPPVPPCAVKFKVMFPEVVALAVMLAMPPLQQRWRCFRRWRRCPRVRGDRQLRLRRRWR